ncbi:MAG: DnaD domain protein [Huintestinicola sp.]
MSYKINWGISDGVFAVPDVVVDSFLKLAGGKAVKVLLYLLRTKKVPEPDELDMSAEDVEDALSYWKQVGLIYKDDSAPPEIGTAVKTSETAKQPEKTEAAPTAKTAPPKPQKALLPAEIAKRAEESEEIAFLFKSAEECLSKILTFDDQRTLLWIHDHLGMSADIILMLAAYCVSINHKSMAYIEKMAIDWHDKDITTHELADREILLLQKRFSMENRIVSRLELNRKLTSSEAAFAAKWAEMDIPIELILLAYDKSIPHTQKLSFNYMNKILVRWYENGVTTPEQAEEFDAKTKPEDGTGKRKAASSSGGQQRRNASAEKPLSSDISSQPSFDLGAIFEHAKNTAPKLRNTDNNQ